MPIAVGQAGRRAHGASRSRDRISSRLGVARACRVAATVAADAASSRAAGGVLRVGGVHAMTHAISLPQ